MAESRVRRGSLAAMAPFALVLAACAPRGDGHPKIEGAPLAQRSRGLPPGSAAPKVTFTLQDGFDLSLALLAGKVVTVSFCAAATDPACVREAEGLGRHREELFDHHAIVLGVSPEDAAAHKALIARYQLPFDLATDADGHLARAFAVPAGEHDPTTFLIGRDGNIRAVWHGADPEAHARATLAAAD